MSTSAQKQTGDGDSPNRNHPVATTIFILFTLLLDSIGFGLTVPVLPSLVEEFVAGGPSNASYFVGPLLSVSPIALLLCAPLLSRLSDRFGRRTIVLLTLMGALLDYLIMANARTLWLLFLARTISGTCGAILTVTAAYIADVAPLAKRTYYFGLMGAAYGLGLIVGPAVGGLLGELGPHSPFWAAAGVTTVNLICSIFLLPESLPPSVRRPFQLCGANPLSSLAKLRQSQLILRGATAFFFYELAGAMTRAIWVLFVELRLGWTSVQVGASVAVASILSVLVQGGLTPVVISRLGDRVAAVLGLGTNIVALSLLAFVEYGWELYAALAFGAPGWIAGPAIQSVISRSARGNEQGELQRGLTSLTTLSWIFGPIVAGLTFGYFTSSQTRIFLPGVVFLLAALSILSALAAYIGLLVVTYPAHSEEPNLDNVSDVK